MACGKHVGWESSTVHRPRSVTPGGGATGLFEWVMAAFRLPTVWGKLQVSRAYGADNLHLMGKKDESMRSIPWCVPLGRLFIWANSPKYRRDRRAGVHLDFQKRCRV